MNCSKKSSVPKHKKSEELSNIIKSTRMSLRIASLNKDDEEVRLLWLKHTSNKQLLQEYADVAHSLAARHGKPKKSKDCKIRWTYNALKEYFYGGLQTKKLEKETRRVANRDPSSLKDYNKRARAVLKRYEEVNKLRILDVGSCYNPFGKFDDLEVTPIDLHPANPEVHRCDFLDLKITGGEDILEDISSLDEKRPINEKKSIYNKFFSPSPIWEKFNILLKSVLNINLQNKGISKNINDNLKKKKKLSDTHGIEKNDCDIPRKIEFKGSLEKSSEENIISYGNNSENLSVNKDGNYISELKAAAYDAVIFSYFLDYIPTAKLRYECCLKAYKLLKPSGILCIATPDIRKVKSNIHIFKLWKCTLQFIGFERIKYEKHPNFHAMIFRKNLSPATLIEHAEADLNSLRSIDFSKKLPNLNWQTVRYSMYDIYDKHFMKEENNTYKE